MKSLRLDLTVAILVALGFFGSSTAAAAKPPARVEAGSLALDHPPAQIITPRSQEDPFVNEDVVTMIQAGFAKETIIEAIRSHGRGFDTSVEALIALKNAGVGEDIIVEILAAARAEADLPSVASSEIDDGLPSEDGVYALRDGIYVPLVLEPIEWRSAGFLGGRSERNGLTTIERNARLATLHSPFELSGRPEMILVCWECESAFDYHLVRANDEDDKREFRISFQIIQIQDSRGRWVDGNWVTRGGTGQEKINYAAENLAAGQFKLELPELEPGDYALLPSSPGGNPENSIESVMHTFRLMEP